MLELETVKQLDIDATVAINRLSGNIFFDSAMIIASSPWVWIGAGVVTAVWIIHRRNGPALTTMFMALIALCCTDYISFEVVKQLVRRERPCWEGHVSWVMHSCGGSYGFTSNHAANAAAIVTTLWLSRSVVSIRLLAIGCLLAALVGFSRVYLGVHYLGDVLGGFILGAVVAFCIKILLVKTPGKRGLDSISMRFCDYNFGNKTR